MNSVLEIDPIVDNVRNRLEYLKERADEAERAYRELIDQIYKCTDPNSSNGVKTERVKDLIDSQNLGELGKKKKKKRPKKKGRPKKSSAVDHPIKLYREKKKLTQSDFAEGFGFSVPSVVRWEQGSNMTEKTIEKLGEINKRLAGAIKQYQE